jgi:hypothetical protein
MVRTSLAQRFCIRSFFRELLTTCGTSFNTFFKKILLHTKKKKKEKEILSFIKIIDKKAMISYSVIPNVTR